MECPDCQDTGKITLFTTIEDCKSCKLATIGRYILSDLRDTDGESHWDEIEPLYSAVANKTSIELRLFVNTDLYETMYRGEGNQLELKIVPRLDSYAYWSYLFGNMHDEVCIQVKEEVEIDGDIYKTFHLKHSDNLNNEV